MALTIGELVGYIDLDDSGATRTLDSVGKGLGRLQSTTSSSMASIEGTVSRALQSVEQEAIQDLNRVALELASALDPTHALSDVNRLVSEFATQMDHMEDEAGRGGQGVVEQLKRHLDDAEDVARRSGDDAGKSFGDGLGQSSKSRMSGIGSNLIGSFKGLGWAAAGTAAAGLLMGAIKSAIEREDIFATLSARIGAFGPEAEKYGKIAGDLYNKGFGESLEDAAGAVESVVHNLGGIEGASKQNVGQIAQDGLAAAKILKTDVSEAVRSAGQLVKTGLAKDWSDAFDQIVVMTQKGGDASGDLLDTINEYGTQFREVGISGPKAFGLLQQAAAAGARDLDTAADAIKEFAIRSKESGNADVRAAFKDLGLDADKMFKTFAEGGPKADKAFKTVVDKLKAMQDPLKQNTAATALFGPKAEDLGDALYALDPSAATKKLGEFKGAVQKASNAMSSTPAADAEKWSRSWGDALSTVGGFVLDQIRDFFPSPAEFEEQWNSITSWFSDTVGPFFSDLWSGVTSKTGEWWEKIKTTVSEKGQALVDWLKALPGKIGGFLSTGWESLRTKASEAWEKIKTAVSEKGSALLSWVGELPGKIKEKLGNMGSLLLQAGKDLLSGLWNGIQSSAGWLKQKIGDFFGNLLPGWAREMLGIHSPSKVFAQIGDFAMQGLAKGILGGSPIVDAAMAAVIKAVTAKAAQALNLGAGVGGKLPAGIGALPSGPSGASPVVVTPAKLDDYAGTAYAGNAGGGYGSGVVVNMYGSTIREEADIGRLGSEFAFTLRARG